MACLDVLISLGNVMLRGLLVCRSSVGSAMVRPVPHESFTASYSTRYEWSASLGLYGRPVDAWDKLDKVNGERY